MISKKDEKRKQIIRTLVCVFVVFAYFMPIYLLGNVSIREATDFSSKLWPTENPTLAKYELILTTLWFGRPLAIPCCMLPWRSFS